MFHSNCTPAGLLLSFSIGRSRMQLELRCIFPVSLCTQYECFFLLASVVRFADRSKYLRRFTHDATRWPNAAGWLKLRNTVFISEICPPPSCHLQPRFAMNISPRREWLVLWSGEFNRAPMCTYSTECVYEVASRQRMRLGSVQIT